MESKIYVWDKFVRIFHWSLVVFFIISYLTGENESDLHIYSGYIILGLVIARIVWGFIGSKHARFTDFVKRPGEVMAYTRGMTSGHPEHYLGHNPLGGVMVIVMLLILLVTTISGLKLYAVEEGKGPFANSHQISPLTKAYAHGDEDDDTSKHKHARNDEDEEIWEEIHEVAVNLMLALIVLHIAGVIVSGRLHKESLIKAMLTGYKKRTGEDR